MDESHVLRFDDATPQTWCAIELLLCEQLRDEAQLQRERTPQAAPQLYASQLEQLLRQTHQAAQYAKHAPALRLLSGVTPLSSVQWSFVAEVVAAVIDASDADPARSSWDEVAEEAFRE